MQICFKLRFRCFIACRILVGMQLSHSSWQTVVHVWDVFLALSGDPGGRSANIAVIQLYNAGGPLCQLL